MFLDKQDSSERLFPWRQPLFKLRNRKQNYSTAAGGYSQPVSPNKSGFDLDHIPNAETDKTENDLFKKTDSNIQEISYSLVIEEAA